ncbi:MAG TPA: hypothetical protein VI454_00285 [Verrucomicrobiae bacterium]|jgi:hypothetical protein
MNTVPLATFNELEPAQQLQERLQQAGIQSTLRDESKLERFWFMSDPLAAIHLGVSQPDYLRARAMILEWDKADAVLKEAVHCPECNSTRVEYPQTSRKFVTPMLANVLMVLRLAKREFYCLDCHFMCPTFERLEPERDALGWSYESKHWHPEAGGRTRRFPSLGKAWQWVTGS